MMATEFGNGISLSLAMLLEITHELPLLSPFVSKLQVSVDTTQHHDVHEQHKITRAADSLIHQ